MSTNEYRREYYRKRYNEDPEFRERMKGYIRKYQSSDKGKIATKKSNETWRAKHLDEVNDIKRKKYYELKAQGICPRCQTSPKGKNNVICDKCRTYSRLRAKQVPQVRPSRK